MFQNNTFLHISHRRTTTQKRPSPCTTATRVSNFKCLQAFSQREWSGPHKNSSPSQRWQSLVRASRKSQHAGLEAVDNEAVVAEAALGGRDGVAQHWATTWPGGWFVSCFLAFLVSHLSNCARCVRLFCGSHDKIRSVMLPRC